MTHIISKLVGILIAQHQAETRRGRVESLGNVVYIDTLAALRKLGVDELSCRYGAMAASKSAMKAARK